MVVIVSSYLLNSDHLAPADRTERGSCGRHQGLQVVQPVRWPAENYQRDPPRREILLIGNTLIDGDENIKSGGFGGVQKAAILQSGEFGKPGRLAVVAWKKKPDALVNTFVN
jgi:hypothetical protein